MKEAEYSEVAKMVAVKEKSQAIGEFIEWLEGHKAVVFAQWAQEVCPNGYSCSHKHEPQLFPMHYDIETLLADFFDIDLNKVEKEKRAILKMIREGKS